VKRTTKIVSVFLASLFAIFFVPTGVIQPVYASTGCGVFCPNYDTGNPTIDPEGELELAEDTTEYIAYFLGLRYDSVYSYINEDASLANYANTIETLANSYDEAGFFSKGHRNLRGDDWNSIGLYDHTGWPESTVWDSTISQLSEGGNFKFVFIWHCSTAELYKEISGYYSHPTYPGGMPLAFTHDDNMNLYGQDTGYHVFLGWLGGSPNFVAQFPDGQEYGYWQYAHWAYLFFSAVAGNYNVEGALSYACNYMSNLDFTCSSLYYKLFVWGCEDICLPY
jgi:hypothetical protein